MANHVSALKPRRQTEPARMNRANRSAYHQPARSARGSRQGDCQPPRRSIARPFTLDKSVQKGILHDNTVSATKTA